MANEIYWKNSNIIIRFNGTVTADEIMSVNDLIYGDSRFDSMNYQIFDYSKVEKMAMNEIDSEVIGTLDKTASMWNRKLKVAVVSNNDFIDKLTQTYKKTISDTAWEVRSFPSIDDALQWCEEE
ncbi:hypothetical protein GM418_06550 [Maribellus comscasis]|uniref:STAS/SEC14 domain-containing protein n=1 Tax=Maribellus comscasis TaxID=2681766 RepID=A0A6I6JQM2_9BACT|nr:STAS/SEC14 domain-containing protein [Maribellus comscasis]QGY43330.1 hypothetical protein GM418_06550 [Maribellus comscasis]